MSLCAPLSAWCGWGWGYSAGLFCAYVGDWKTRCCILCSKIVFVESPKSEVFSLYFRSQCLRRSVASQNPILQDVSPSDLQGVISDEQAMDSSTREAELWTTIEQLPERCREIFLMSKRDGMTYREIAEELQLSEKTVELQISKALKILRGRKVELSYVSWFFVLWCLLRLSYILWILI